MTVFEIVFALVSVILGLALTQMVGNLHRLALAGRRTRWAPEPLLLTVLVFLIIMQVWLDQWNEHAERSVSVGVLILQVLKMLAIFFAAASVLPDGGEPEMLDLKVYYYRSRRLPYGAMIVGLFLFFLYGRIMYPAPFHVVNLLVFLSLPALYATLIFAPWRAYHIVVLALVIALFALDIAGDRIGG